eukprot:CCRYP_017129-RA/>CCRYP_017129-RA protein AED:0.31 eAED:0.31 QI:0/-1/0/1/-1/1/1/0/108
MPYSSKSSTEDEGPEKGLISDRSSKQHSLLHEWSHNDLVLDRPMDCPRKNVTFSEYSELRIYNKDILYQSKNPILLLKSRNSVHKLNWTHRAFEISYLLLILYKLLMQ